MNTIMTKKLTTREKIRSIFARTDNRWLTSAELIDQVDAATQTIYSTISNMATAVPAQLERETQSGDYKYRLPQSVFESIKVEFAESVAARFEQPILLQTESTDLSLQSTEVSAEEKEEQNKVENELAESKRTRQKMWNAEDQNAFCMAYLQARVDNPAHGFEMLAAIAQRVIPTEKRKAELKFRSQIPWFEREIEVAKVEFDRVRAERAAQEKREAEEREAAERANSAAEKERQHQALMQTALQSVGNDMFLGEIMRRGQSLIETMLINALSNPTVQHAIAASVFGNQPNGERRHPSRVHDPRGPQEVRERLQKVMVVGINKPQHQQLVTSRMKDMYDMRLFSSNTPSAQLKAAAIGADIVIIMSEHVGHHDEAAIKSANVKYERMTGDRRALEDSLSKRYLEKGNESNGN